MPNIRQHLNLFFARRILKILPLDVEELSLKIVQNSPFSFSRFGDGEWTAILGHTGANCDGHEYSKELQSALALCLADKKGYLYGMQPYAAKNLGGEIASYIKRNKIDIPWYNASVLHDANREGKLAPFIQALRGKKCIVMGPDYMHDLKKRVVDYSDFIEIPRVNCFNAYDSILAQIKKVAANSNGNVYLFSASMASNVFIHNLYDQIGDGNWLLDIGSLWDVYLGVNSRGVYQKEVWDEIIKKNLA